MGPGFFSLGPFCWVLLMPEPVLIACERSGRVRDAFLSRGVYALSCDILPSDSPGPHIQADLKTILSTGREPRVWRLPPSPDRAALLSLTFQGVADAMASQ